MRAVAVLRERQLGQWEWPRMETPPFDAGALRGESVLIVGATGFYGSALVKRLAALHARVYAVSRNARSQNDGSTIWHAADASDAEQVRRLFDTAKPTIVFHLTSDSQGGRDLSLVPASLRNDVVATVNVLHAAAADGGVKRLVMTGSLEEPLAVGSAEPTPVSPYSAAKWVVSAYGRMFRRLYGLDVRIVRPMMTYGPGQKDYKLVPSTILSLLRGSQIIIGSGSRLVDFVFLDDIVEGMIRAALAPELSETVDLGSGNLVPIADVVREIANQLGRPDLLRFGEQVRGEEIVRAADAERAFRAIGFVARTDLISGISKTIDWYRERVAG